MKLYKLDVAICELCLKGEGSECHTPGCALFLHTVPPGRPTLWESWHDVPGALVHVGEEPEDHASANTELVSDVADERMETDE